MSEAQNTSLTPQPLVEKKKRETTFLLIWSPKA